MKKSISVILVAALMLFAFTACEQQVPNFLTKTPSVVVIEQVGDVFATSEATPSDFNVIVTFEDGTETTYPGLNLVDITADKVTAKVGSVTGEGYVALSKVTGVESLTPDEDLEIEQGTDSVATVPTTVVVTYTNHNGEDKTYEKQYSTLKYTISDSTFDKDEAQVGDKVDVKVSVSPSDGITKEFTLEATVVPKTSTTYVDSLFDHLEVVYTYKDSTGAAYTGSTHWVGDKVSVAINAVDSNGNKDTALVAGTDYYWKDDKKPANLTDIAISLTSKATYTVIDAKGRDEVTVEIVNGTDYVTDVAVAPKANEKFTIGQQASLDQFDFTVTLASNDAEAAKSWNYNSSNIVAFVNPTVAKDSSGIYTPQFLVKYGKDLAEVKPIKTNAISGTNLIDPSTAG